VDAQGEALGEGRLAHARLAHEERVVLPAAAEHADGALDLQGATNERVDLARRGERVEVGRVLRERIARGLVALLALFAPRRVRGLFPGALGQRGLVGVLARAMGNIVDHVHALHALLVQEVQGVRLRLAKHRHQHARHVDGLLLRRQHVNGRALEHPVDAEGLLHVEGGALGHALHRVLEEAPQLALESAHVGAAGAQGLGGPRVLQEGQEQVLQGDVLVAQRLGLGDGGAEGVLQLFGDGRGLCHVSRPRARC
jgi:hypothetical protein